jgi:hypothetical protein
MCLHSKILIKGRNNEMKKDRRQPEYQNVMSGPKVNKIFDFNPFSDIYIVSLIISKC